MVEHDLKRRHPARSVRFCTFAYYDVRDTVLHALNECGYSVRLPVRMAKKRVQMQKVCSHSFPVPAECGAAGLGAQAIVLLAEYAVAERRLSPDWAESAFGIIPSAEDEYIARWQRGEVRTAVGALPQKEREVVVQFYGMDGIASPRTFAQIARGHQKTRAWACALEKKARARLALRLNLFE